MCDHGRVSERVKRTAWFVACTGAGIAVAVTVVLGVARSLSRTDPVQRRAMPTSAGGLPDYSAEIARRQLAGHPLRENAFIPLLHAGGEGLLDKDADRAAVATQLGIASWPEVERPLQLLSAFLRSSHCTGQDADECERRVEGEVMTGCREGRWAPGSRELAMGWLAQGTEGLAWLAEAADKPMLFIPVDDYASERVNVVTLISLHRALLCHGRLLLEAGDIEGAARAAVDLWKLGGLVRPEHSLLVYAAGLTAWTSALALTSALTQGELDPARAQRMLDELAPLEARIDATRVLERARIDALAQTALALSAPTRTDGEGRSSPVLDVERALQRVDRAYDSLVHAASQPASRRTQALSEAEHGIRSRLGHNPDVYLWCPTRLFPARCRAAMTDQLTDIGMIGGMLDWSKRVEQFTRKAEALEQARAALGRGAQRSARPRP